MTPEEHAYTHRLGELYDRLLAVTDLPQREAYQSLIDILREYSYDDVVWMLNVIKEDFDAQAT